MVHENLEELVKAQGFENEKEFHKLVSSIDLTDPCKLLLFNIWKEK
jgi:hypothetical protein